jgi:hypothetical protein
VVGAEARGGGFLWYRLPSTSDNEYYVNYCARHFGPDLPADCSTFEPHRGGLLRRVPLTLRDLINCYLADARRVFVDPTRKLRAEKRRVTGLGTRVGGIGPNTCAHQVRSAFEKVVLGKWQEPRTWVEATDQHQSLYTDRPGRLQLRQTKKWLGPR